MATPNTESRLTPPIVDPEDGPDDGRNPAAATMTPEQIKAGMRARLSEKNAMLERKLAEQKRLASDVKVLRADIAEAERFLRAVEPRASRKAK